MKSQMQIFYEEQRKVGDANQTVMELGRAGMTREDLSRNIARRPVLWSRFSAWLNTLPSSNLMKDMKPA